MKIKRVLLSASQVTEILTLIYYVVYFDIFLHRVCVQ